MTARLTDEQLRELQRYAERVAPDDAPKFIRDLAAEVTRLRAMIHCANVLSAAKSPSRSSAEREADYAYALNRIAALTQPDNPQETK